MGKYNGPARVIADRVPYEVSAQLVSFTEYKALVSDSVGGQEHVHSGHTRWIGTLRTRTTADAWTIRRSDDLILRTEEDWGGHFTVTGGGGLGSSELRINGSGNPPFRDTPQRHLP
ncbi:hypothetical protein PV963_43140 [Streptomyces coeruleorubidus]|uniref:hypothetical protein n=1 Tax=Streptomyces coeruleorubidus TaxID=116188 RepID=UPI00237F8480|nr:hypothetical protein [Streptomyces coeruleorubidus]WDV56631.1 hypothetical protein PV963_43140 [Streptomyces coeruleorubidus]